ncbi:MAG: twin-arginine translocase TatA/TatE family subunit [Nitrospirae bacterium]|nr:twin-arginine translocase TatA/TatE family subunit [Nitrospirota bacterium]
MFDLGAQELIVIFIVAFLVFGPKRLPELGRTLGKGIRELKAAINNLKNSIDESELNVAKEIKDIKTDLADSIYKSIEPEINKITEVVENKKPGNPAVDNAGAAPVEEKKEKTEPGKDG